jgi:hypothetical protein
LGTLTVAPVNGRLQISDEKRNEDENRRYEAYSEKR